MSLIIQRALAISNSSEGFIVYSKSTVRNMDKEYHIKDIVYFMYDNKPAKGVIIGKCKQKLIQLDIDNDEELIQCLNSDYVTKEHTKTQCNNFNRIVKIDSDDGYNKYTPINGWFKSDDLYNNIDDLFCSLLETKL